MFIDVTECHKGMLEFPANSHQIRKHCYKLTGVNRAKIRSWFLTLAGYRLAHRQFCVTSRQSPAPPGHERWERELWRRNGEDGAGTDLIAVRVVVEDDSRDGWLLAERPQESGLRTPLEMTEPSLMGPANPITLYCEYEAWCVIQFEENRGPPSAWESSHSAMCRQISGTEEILQRMCWLHLAGGADWAGGEEYYVMLAAFNVEFLFIFFIYNNL